ncbi:MAG TPA: PEP-CTERM sorting domain-containing protein [Myxococcales bacterium]|nr:PEP-CTERM sorting domain-containing protein [Myxococcales bacterium]
MRIQSGKINTGVKLAMKKALALGAFALVMALPLVSSATSIVSNFSSSSTGTSAIAIGDTIQFEIVLTVDGGVNVDTLFFQVGGDVTGALASSNPAWAGTSHVASNWEWHYTDAGKVNFDTNGTIVPFGPAIAGPNGVLPVVGSYGFFGTNRTGKGVGSMVGTVTITADANGVYQGGGFIYPTLDGIFGSGGEIATTVTTAAFTVVPEPGTAVLMLLGLGGLGVMGRKNR